MLILKNFTDQQRKNGSHKTSMQIFVLKVGKIYLFLN